MTPKVSIVLPAYNHEAYIGAAIQSALAQTFDDFELIIIDDGSTDGTRAVIEQFTDPRIRYFRQENQGLSATLNCGLSLARGKYFGFLPSDDMYEPEKLARQVAHLDAHPTVGVVFSYQTLIDAAGAPLRDDEVEAWFRVPYETKEDIFPALFERNFLAAPSALMRMACFDRVGTFDESLTYAQDYDLWLRVLKHYDITLLREPLIRYRWHGGNLTYRATEWTETERATVLLKAFRDLQIEDVFPSLRTSHLSERPAGYAKAYEKLAASVERNGLPGLLPMATIYRAEAGRWRLQQDSGLRPRAVGHEVDNLAPACRDIAGKITILMEVRSLDTGGLEEVVFDLARSLDRERFTVLIVCVERGGQVARKCQEDGIPVEVLGEHKHQQYSELLSRHRVDLVCAHYSTLGGPLAAERGVPLISVVHNLYIWLPTHVFSEMRMNDPYVTRYVAVSDGVARFLTRRFDIPPEKISIIQNGLDVARLATQERESAKYSREDFGLSEEDYVFLHVAAITETKGHNVLIRAMKEVIQKYPRIKLLCAGDTLSQAYADIIRGRVKAWGLDSHVQFTGYVDRIADLYRLADAFVLPSLIDGWSLAVGEAMFFGLPLILTRVGSAETIVDDPEIGTIIEPSYKDIFDLKPDEIWNYCIEEEPSNASQLAEAMIDFCERRLFWKKSAERRRAKILDRHTLAAALWQYEELFVREALRVKEESEGGYWKRPEFVHSLESVSARSKETAALIDCLRRRLDEVAALAKQSAKHLAALDARGQAQFVTLTEHLDARGQAQFATLTEHLDAMESRQQARLDALGQRIMDRLSFTARLRARLRRFLGTPDELIRRDLQRLFVPSWISSGEYIVEDNSEVALYTDLPDLFPGYTPRRSLTDHQGLDRVQVSLIACAKNESDNVGNWVTNIIGQTRPPDEIIVVDTGSQDETVDLLRRFATQSPVPFRVIEEPGVNIARARNIAIAHARFPFIAVTDFGCRARPEWLDRLATPFEVDPETQVVAGWKEPVDRDWRPIQRGHWSNLTQISPQTFLPASHSVAFTKEAWEVVGGYPEWLTLTGEDTYFDLELKRHCRKWAFVPGAIVEWQAPDTLLSYWQKWYRWSIGDGESGVNTQLYWQSARRIAAACIGSAVVLGSVAFGLALGSWRGVLLASTMTLVWIGGLVGVIRKRDIAIADLAWEASFTFARVIGFLRGSRRRPVVARRRQQSIKGVFFVLSGVPIDDTGGGARCTQITLELLRQGFAVCFVNKFPKYESTNLNLKIQHPNLFTYSLLGFQWEQFLQESGLHLEEKRLAAIVEFPLRDFLPLMTVVRERGGVVMYDLLDDWHTSLGSQWYTPEVEKEIIAASQVFIATTPSLVTRLEQRSGRPVTLLPNAVNTHLFDPRRRHPRPSDLPDAEWIIIYVGALWGEWFDWDLLLKVALSYPEASVVVIGDYRGQCPSSPPNLHFLGLKPQRDLPAYLAHADVAIIPWKVNAITHATSPLKVYEYLAMRKPVVTPELDALADTPFLLVSRDSEEFVRNIARARDIDCDEAALDLFIKRNSWEARISEFVKLVWGNGRE